MKIMSFSPLKITSERGLWVSDFISARSVDRFVAAVNSVKQYRLLAKWGPFSGAASFFGVVS